MSASVGTPVQRGVGYEASPARVFNSGTIVPVASTYNEKEVANGLETEDEEMAIDNFSTSNHHLVVTGDFKLKSGTSCPNKGDVLTDDSSPAKKFVVTGDPEVKGFSPATGHPFMVTLELKYWPLVAAALS
jgi:hypothetical protein